MRILHVGTGYLASTGGGHIRYALDLMAAQAEAGHQVSYLCSGTYDLAFVTRLRRRRLGTIDVFEVRNPRPESSRLGRQARPELEISEKRSERLARAVLRQVRPDLIHIMTLQGWPASLVDVVCDSGRPAVFSVGNFHAVCPTTRLFDEVADEVCTDFDGGRRCCRCNASRASEFKLRNAERFRLGLLARWAPSLFAAGKWAKATASGLLSKHKAPEVSRDHAPQRSEDPMAAIFRARRTAFVTALNRLHLIAGVSTRVCELLVSYGVEQRRVRALHPVLSDIQRISRRPPAVPGRPIRFGFLNKLTHLKGAETLNAVFLGMDPSRVRLLVFGRQSERGHAAIAPLVRTGVAELTGEYSRAQLDDVLSSIDVGLIPSILEETFGLVGQEFLAKGIPILASRIGGIPDSVEDGVNGRLLPPRDVAAWRAAVERLVESPAEIARLATGIRPVKTMSEHLAEVLSLYHEAAEIAGESR
jgi:glycosyltransferase involved in cell wall biosynthesis